MKESPDLFGERHHRRLVLEPRRLKRFAARSDVVIGVAAETPYSLFIIDLVEAVEGDQDAFPYQRVIYKAQLRGAINTVVAGRIAREGLGELGSIVMVRQERHATGDCHLELPRGFGEVAVPGADNALSELRDETGFVGVHAYPIGTTFTDSGLTDAQVTFYCASVIDRVEPKPEKSEAILRVELLTEKEVVAAIRSGDIRDAFTIQAITLMGVAAPQP